MLGTLLRPWNTLVYRSNMAPNIMKFTIQPSQSLHKSFILSMSALIYFSNLTHPPPPLLPYCCNYSDLHKGSRKTHTLLYILVIVRDVPSDWNALIISQIPPQLSRPTQESPPL